MRALVIAPYNTEKCSINKISSKRTGLRPSALLMEVFVYRASIMNVELHGEITVLTATFPMDINF